MFQKSDLNVFDWWLFWILMMIPIIDIIVLLIIMFSSDTNPTLRSMIWAQFLIGVIVIVLFMTILSPYLQDVLQYINNYLY